MQQSVLRGCHYEHAERSICLVFTPTSCNIAEGISNEKSLVSACLINEIKGLTEKHTMLSASGKKKNLLGSIISRTTQ